MRLKATILFSLLSMASAAGASSTHEKLAELFNTATTPAELSHFPTFPSVPTSKCFFSVEGVEELYEKDPYVRMTMYDGDRSKEILGSTKDLTEIPYILAENQEIVQFDHALVITDNMVFAQLIMTTELRKIDNKIVGRISFDNKVESYLLCD